MSPQWTPCAGDDYWALDRIRAWCDAAAAAFPEWVSVTQVGVSLEGRPIFLVTLGHRDGDTESRPALWIDGGTHCAEWAGVMSCIYSLSKWLEQLESGTLGDWLRHNTVYVLPCISPDGYVAMLERGETYLRSTLREPPTGTLRTGLHPGDVDGDGMTRWMRWKHPAGAFIEDPDVPLFMRPRTLADDPADAWVVATEGHLLEWDGVRWTQSTLQYGLDLNRNFPGNWDVFRQFGMDGGEVPMSAPESRAVVDAFRARKNVSAAVTNHTFTGCILTQPYRQDSPLDKADQDVMEALAQDAVAGTGYRCIRVWPKFVYDAKTPIRGVWADTLSNLFGVAGYTLEIWDPWAAAGVEQDDPAGFFLRPDPDVVRALVAYGASQPNAMPWTPFDHPQLGPVEIGGFDRQRTLRNPPVDRLNAELEIAFTVHERARRALPVMTGTVTSTPLGGGLTQIRLVLENLGFLNTSGLRRAEQLGLDPGITVSLQVQEGQSVVQGDVNRSLEHLDGWGSTRMGGGRGYLHVRLPFRGHRAVAEWVVQGQGTATVTWSSLRAGQGSEIVSLSPHADQAAPR